MNAIGGPSYRQQPNPYSRSQQEHRQLALPSTAPAPSRLVEIHGHDDKKFIFTLALY